MSFMQVGLAFVTAGLVIAGFFKETSMMFAGYVLVLKDSQRLPNP
jgi:hypothetical protein